MILTCPSCSTRYLADPASFSPSGRMVRCANCGHSWFQKPPDDMPKSVAGGSGGGGAAAAPGGMQRLAPSGEDSGGRGFRLPVAVSTMALWLLLGVAIFAFGAIVYQYRVEIVRGWPQTATLYNLLGIDVNSAGMIFRNVGYDLETQEGLSVLAVRGSIVNITEQDLPIPRVRISLRDETGTELYHWTVVVEETRLNAGTSTEFVTRLSSPPAGTHDIEVRFAEGAE